MKRNLLRALIGSLLFTAGALFASVRPLILPPLSSEDREMLVRYLRGTAELNRMWGFYYAYTDDELRGWNMRADGFDTSANWLENLPFPSRTEIARSVAEPQRDDGEELP